MCHYVEDLNFVVEADGDVLNAKLSYGMAASTKIIFLLGVPRMVESEETENSQLTETFCVIISQWIYRQRC